MKKLLVLTLLCVCFQSLSAQEVKTDSESDRKTRISEERKNMNRDSPDAKKKIDTAALLSAADVGEPDSFGKNAKFLGTAATGIVYVYSSCDPAVLLADLDLVLGADDRCLAIPTPGTSASATFNDIGRITIPGKSVDNTIWFIQNNLVDYDLFNPNANSVLSNFSYSPSYTLESTALNDPAAIDPNTGLPMNGSFTTGVNASKVLLKTYAAGANDITSERFSTSATRGFARGYFADLGLPQSVINKLYNRPLTIRLNLRVRANFFSFGQFGYSVRFFGN
ncbi:MAG: hypothetical protein JSS81_25105 [Acidobacteria bacterium]|nr:hypothetical protein [Acidobacteriota bacterium]